MTDLQSRLRSLTDVSVTQILRYFAIGCVVALLADVPSNWAQPYLLAKAALLVMLIGSLFAPVRVGLVFLLMLTIVSRDIVQATSESLRYGNIMTASLWQGSLGPLGPSVLILAAALLLTVRRRIWFGDRLVFLAAVWFATVPVVTGLLHDGFSSEVVASQAPVDMKMGAFLLVGIVLYRSYLKRAPEFLPTLAAALVGSALARHTVDFLYWAVDVGSLMADINRVSVDSTKGTVVLLTLLAVYLVVSRRHVPLGVVLGICSTLLLITYNTRTQWLTATVGALVTLTMLRANRRVLALPVVVLILIGSVELLAATKPEVLDLVSMRTSRLWDDRSRDTLLSHIDPVRSAEMKNSVQMNRERYALLWGSGYGSYYTEVATPFPRKLEDAFPLHSIRSGRFYRCHNYVTQVLFKHGIVGMIIISSLWVVPWWRCFRGLRRRRPDLLTGVGVAVTGFLVTAMLQASWSAKGYFLNGFLIAFCLALAESARAESRPEVVPATDGPQTVDPALPQPQPAVSGGAW